MDGGIANSGLSGGGLRERRNFRKIEALLNVGDSRESLRGGKDLR